MPDSQIFFIIVWLGRFGKLKTPDKIADWYSRLVRRMFPIWRRYAMVTFSLAAFQRFEQLRSQRMNIALMDLRIAAIALENGLTVVTRKRAILVACLE